MKKIDFDFLMGGFCNPHKDQVLLHALCNLKGIPFNANMGAERAESISMKAQSLYSTCGINHPITGDFGTCSNDLRATASLLINRGNFSKAQLENEISVLMATVYSDPEYIECMGPFF